ncbi:MAG: protein-L-isoaspartate O-methyltransferase [Anaerolineae bacterium SM23_ 63]|nr:MAG: protein-L-isoaspartate O-methyltransferase [Anaerolineae bacterium SM23_ 63]HEY45950.1 protein-L-isoaspartate(D-aspartate) O-methyltransferase [Anaerolineae bacterium]
MKESDELTYARERMVEDQIRSRGIKDARVLEAMATIPRHVFVPSENKHLAYADAPLPIGHRQTISQPFIVALMTELLCLGGDETVLEVGTGSGYQAAILGRLAKHVYSLERIPELAEHARGILNALKLDNVEVLVADGSQGLPEHAPFGGIMVTAAAPKVPVPLKEQLADGGRLVLPVGEQAGQILECWERQGDDFRRERVAPVAFVPLVGEHGWDSDERPFSWWL